jgi:hypothetical protein
MLELNVFLISLLLSHSAPCLIQNASGNRAIEFSSEVRIMYNPKLYCHRSTALPYVKEETPLPELNYKEFIFLSSFSIS